MVSGIGIGHLTVLFLVGRFGSGDVFDDYAGGYVRVESGWRAGCDVVSYGV